jgi:hypothetical protein
VRKIREETGMARRWSSTCSASPVTRARRRRLGQRLTPGFADRGFGKPTQTEVRFSGDTMTLSEAATQIAKQLSRDEVRLMIEDMRARARQTGGDADENGL